MGTQKNIQMRFYVSANLELFCCYFRLTINVAQRDIVSLKANLNWLRNITIKLNPSMHNVPKWPDRL